MCGLHGLCCDRYSLDAPHRFFFACMVAGKTRLIKLSILKPVHFEEDAPLCHTITRPQASCRQIKNRDPQTRICCFSFVGLGIQPIGPTQKQLDLDNH